MKPLLITAFSWTPGCKKYFKTFVKHAKDSADMMLFFYNDGKFSLKELEAFFQRLDFYPQIVVLDKKWQGNTARFIEVYRYFKENPQPDDRRIIMTDTHDVFFQGPITENNAEIIACPEDKNFQEVDFWRGRATEELMGKPIYNVGCFSMSFRKFMFWLDILNFSWEEMVAYMRKPVDDEKWPFECGSTKVSTAAFFNHVADTISFNNFLYGVMDGDFKVDRTLFCCHNFSEQQGKLIVENGVYYNLNRSKPAIVHQNGDVGKRNKLKEKK